MEKNPESISVEPKMRSQLVTPLDQNETAAALYSGTNSFSIDNKDLNERYKVVSIATGGDD